MQMRKVDIFGIKYAVTDYVAATEMIIEAAKKRVKFSVFALPVHGVVECQQSPDFRKAVDAADLIVPDGQPIKWAMNYFYDAGLKDRVYGPKLTECVLEKMNECNMRIFLYGGSTQIILQSFKQFIQSYYPNIIIAGAYREEAFGVTTLSEEHLNELKPDIVLVGLGCPNQEKWIYKNKNNFVLMGVGAAFSFLSGEAKKPPVWMQSRGLEWLYRLVNEPKRLWRRYFHTNSYFIFLVIKKYILTKF